MQYITYYNSAIGKLLLTADEIGLSGLWLENEKDNTIHLDKKHEEKETEILKQAKKWLDIYFEGKEPDFMPPLHITGTSFQEEIWDILLTIPYGKTIAYGDIAQIIAKKRGIKRMSAQAVGGAVGHNKISIIIPCHRVIGKSGGLVGYAGGIDKKIYLLKLEKAYHDEF